MKLSVVLALVCLVALASAVDKRSSHHDHKDSHSTRHVNEFVKCKSACPVDHTCLIFDTNKEACVMNRGVVPAPIPRPLVPTGLTLAHCKDELKDFDARVARGDGLGDKQPLAIRQSTKECLRLRAQEAGVLPVARSAHAPRVTSCSLVCGMGLHCQLNLENEEECAHTAPEKRSCKQGATCPLGHECVSLSHGGQTCIRPGQSARSLVVLAPGEATATCFDMRCALGQSCHVVGNLATCIVDDVRTCLHSGARCAEDSHCVTDGIREKCVVGVAPVKPLPRPEHAAFFQGPCQDYQCDAGHHCELVRGVAMCVAHQPQLCGNEAECPLGMKCIEASKHAFQCIADADHPAAADAPAKPALAHEACINRRCLDGHNCRLVENMPTCVPDSVRTCPSLAQCPANTWCHVNGEIHTCLKWGEAQLRSL